MKCISHCRQYAGNLLSFNRDREGQGPPPGSAPIWPPCPPSAPDFYRRNKTANVICKAKRLSSLRSPSSPSVLTHELWGPSYEICNKKSRIYGTSDLICLSISLSALLKSASYVQIYFNQTAVHLRPIHTFEADFLYI